MLVVVSLVVLFFSDFEKYCIISINGTKNKHTKIINILLYIMDLNFSIMVVIDFSDIFVLVIEGEEEAPSR